MSDLIHFSETPLRAVHSVAQSVHPGAKPQGLWVSAESDPEQGWATWCRINDFHLSALTSPTRVHLVPDHRLCWLTTAAAIERLTADFGAWPASMDPYPWLNTQGYAIDWAAVAQAYQGLVIAPYQWSCRLAPDTSWYYAWDCASGCIWDAGAIARLEPV